MVNTDVTVVNRFRNGLRRLRNCCVRESVRGWKTLERLSHTATSLVVPSTALRKDDQSESSSSPALNNPTNESGGGTARRGWVAGQRTKPSQSSAATQEKTKH